MNFFFKFEKYWKRHTPKLFEEAEFIDGARRVVGGHNVLEGIPL